MSAAELAFSPLAPSWALMALGAALTLAALGAFARGLKGWLWRALAGGALIAALANPGLVTELREPLPDIALLVVDDSESMAIGERANEAEAIAQTVREAADSDPSLELVEIAGGRDAQGTRLFETIRGGLAEIPRSRLAGVIAASDGRIHDTEIDAEALALNAPAHLMLAGNANAGDRRLIITEAPRYGLVDDPITFTLRVEDSAIEAEGTALVRLSVDGGEEITARARIGEDIQVRARINNRGANVVQIEVDPGPQELSLINNRAAVSVTGVRDRLRVLLITGEPHNGARAWRDLLKSDPSVDLVHFTILRPLEKQDGTPPEELALITFPVFELFQERLTDFDLVIFDRYRRRGILLPRYFNNIAQYVEQGGALLVTTGPPFAGGASLARSPLAGVLPARPDAVIETWPYRPQVSELGERHPVTAAFAGADERWGHWYRRIGAQALGGETLLENPEGEPLLVLDRVGQGRAAMLLSDQAWLWARGHEGGGPHDELFRRVAHWLMGEPELDEERLSATVSDGVLRTARNTLAETPPELEASWPSGRVETLQMIADGPGRFIADTPALETGLVRLRSDDLTTVAASGALNPREYAELSPDPEGLGALRTETGGGVYRLSEGVPDLRRPRAGAVQAGFNWAGLQRNSAYVVVEAERTPLAPALLIVAILLALFAGAWRREGE
ncbi:MAG: hypothetical protein AAFX09_11275 [Pseudomonadota bacterium]